MKNLFISEKNTRWSAHEWRGGRFAAFWKNYPILFNYIEKWNLYENLKAVLPWERKFSTLEKMEYEQKYFFKNWAPRIWGVDSLRHFTKMMLISKILSITVRKMNFSEYLMSKISIKNCPRNVNTALGISCDGEG